MTDGSPQVPDEQELEILQRKMDAARLVYQSAKEAHDKVLQRLKELGVEPDGEMSRNTDAYIDSLEHYRKATMDYNRYLLDRALGPGGSASSSR